MRHCGLSELCVNPVEKWIALTESLFAPYFSCIKAPKDLTTPHASL